MFFVCVREEGGESEGWGVGRGEESRQFVQQPKHKSEGSRKDDCKQKKRKKKKKKQEKEKKQKKKNKKKTTNCMGETYSPTYPSKIIDSVFIQHCC